MGLSSKAGPTRAWPAVLAPQDQLCQVKTRPGKRPDASQPQASFPRLNPAHNTSRQAQGRLPFHVGDGSGRSDRELREETLSWEELDVPTPAPENTFGC